MLSKALTIGAFVAIIGMLTYLVYTQMQKKGASATTDGEADENPVPPVNPGLIY